MQALPAIALSCGGMNHGVLEMLDSHSFVGKNIVGEHCVHATHCLCVVALSAATMWPYIIIPRVQLWTFLPPLSSDLGECM
jgi:hypothetical protein